MRWPIRIQWFLPTALLLVATVTMTAVTSSWLAVSRATSDREEQLDRIVRTFGGARVPYTAQVLQHMRGLSGADFVAASRDRGLMAATLSLEQVPEAWWSETDRTRTIEFTGQRYRLTSTRPPGDPPDMRLFVLIPEATWSQFQREVAWPPLAIGAATLLVLLGVSGILSLRQSRRLLAVRTGLAQLAAGTFEPLPLSEPDDEIRDLTRSANELARQLSQLNSQIRRTERFLVLGQLASGLAHQLRNSVAGARLAIQLHRKRHGESGDETLETALRQLELMNRQTRSLLALSRSEGRDPIPVPLNELVDEVLLLCRPQAEHGHRILRGVVASGASPDVDRDDMQAALLNLITNALEATTEGGEVVVEAAENSDGTWQVTISDNGAGVAENLKETLFEPFVSGKPEGIGIGLTMARAAAERHGGTLEYQRVNNQTIFRMIVKGIEK